MKKNPTKEPRGKVILRVEGADIRIEIWPGDGPQKGTPITLRERYASVGVAETLAPIAAKRLGLRWSRGAWVRHVR